MVGRSVGRRGVGQRRALSDGGRRTDGSFDFSLEPPFYLSVLPIFLSSNSCFSYSTLFDYFILLCQSVLQFFTSFFFCPFLSPDQKCLDYINKACYYLRYQIIWLMKFTGSFQILDRYQFLYELDNIVIRYMCIS